MVIRRANRRQEDRRGLPEERRESGPPARRTSVLLADDHEVVRQGLRLLLETEPDLDVVGEAKDGREAVELARESRPDVVVMDVAMPRLNGVDATREIMAVVPTTRVLVLTAHGDHEYVERALQFGAAGYVLKQTSLDRLAAAIRTVRAGGTYVGSAIPWRDSGRVHATCDARTGPRTRLTSRETEVLQLVAEGAGNKWIARDLGISVKTVEKHRQSLMWKLDIHDVAGLVQYAIMSGVVECCTGRSPY